MAYIIVSSGEVSSGIILDNDTIDLLSGGTANSTTIQNGGIMYVSPEKATANSTTVNSGGYMGVYGRGTANSSIVNSDGILYLGLGGKVIDTTVNSGGSMSISGGSANRVVVNSGGILDIKSGAVTGVVENGGWVRINESSHVTFSPNMFSEMALDTTATVHSGTSAKDITINASGNLYISSGGVVTGAVVNSSGTFHIHESGSANNVTVNSSGYLFARGVVNDLLINTRGWGKVLSGGIIDSATIDGFLHVSSGGIANNVVVPEDGVFVVYSGATANSATASGGWFSIDSGGTANFMQIHDGDVSVYGTANSTTVSSGGIRIGSGGTANFATVYSGCNLCVSTGGSANCITVKNGGSMVVSSGGTATNIIWTPFEGNIQIEAGASATFATPLSGVFYGSDGHLISHAIMMNEIDLEHQTEQLYVLSSGIVNIAEVKLGNMTILSGGTVNSTIVSSSGRVDVYSGGVMNSAVVESGAGINVYEGATLIDVVENGGYVSVWEGADATFVNNTISGLVISGAKTTTVHSATKASNTTVIYRGSMGVIGGTADNTKIDQWGSMTVMSGGTANNTTVNKEGLLLVASNGTATEITENGGYVVVENGANVAFVPYSFSGLVLSNAATIHSGTTAYNTIVNGRLHVSSGGTANSTSVDSNGCLYVSSGGTANSTSVNSNGCLYVSSGGTANNTVWTPCYGFICIADGASITFSNDYSGIYWRTEDQPLSNAMSMNATILDSNSEMCVMSGGTATNATVSCGEINVYSDGMVSNASVDADGAVNVFSGGMADRITVNAYGTLNVFGGIAPSATINGNSGNINIYGGTAISANLSNGDMNVYSGGTAISATISYGGDMDVHSGGKASNTSVTGGDMNVYSGGTVNYSLVDSGTIWTYKDSIVANTILNSGIMIVHGGEIVNTVVNAGGQLWIYSGGMADNVTVNNSGGLFALHSGGTATHVVISSGARLCVDIAPDTLIEGSFCGSAFVLDGHISNYHIPSGFILDVFGGGTADNIAVTSGGSMSIHSGGTAANIAVSTGGKMEVDDGGTINSTTIYGYSSTNEYIFSGKPGSILVTSPCFVYVNSGGIAENTIIGSFAEMHVLFGGTANTVTVNPDGVLLVSAGGTATHIRENGGYVYLSDGAKATFESRTISGLVLGTPGAIDGQIKASIHSGTTAHNVTINKGGMLGVFSGGIANGTVVNWHGYFTVSGGILNDTIMSSFSCLNNASYISSGGTANRTTMIGWTILYVKGIVNSTTIVSSGRLVIKSGGTASHTTISNTDMCYCEGMHLYFGGIAYDTVVDTNGTLFVHGGATANRTLIQSGGYMNVTSLVDSCDDINFDYSPGIANSTTVESYATLYVCTGGIIYDITVESRGKLNVLSGGKITGQMNFANSAFISADAGSILDFDISNLAPGNASALMSDLSVVKGTPTYTLTVFESQADGVYMLASGAANFDSVITVVSASGGLLGSLSVGETVKINGDDYKLNRNNGNLTLSINIETGKTDPVASVTHEQGKDIFLAHVLPEAEYMYGCTPTAIGMILGYYDLYGYENAGFSNLINGDVDPKSRGTDGNAFDMDAFDTVLGRAIASEEYVYRFVFRDGSDTSPEQELEYMFAEDGTLDTSMWNCIADYIGTGQFWRGNNNYSTQMMYGGLNSLYDYSQTDTTDDYSIESESLFDFEKSITICSEFDSRTILLVDRSMECGLDLYVQARGYRMNDSITGTYLTDTNGGSFSFVQYMKEIDAGRPVLIHIDDHSMVGYGYNECTQEIIFDDCYESGQRMVWGDTYNYAGKERKLQAITVIALDESSGDLGPRKPIASADITTPTNDDVLISAIFSADSVVKEYSLDGKTWDSYTEAVLFTENGTVYFRGTDAAGNESEIARYEVTNIDKITPEEPIVFANIISPTNGDVLVSATFSEDSTRKEYSLDGRVWNSYTEAIIFSENGTVFFRGIDEAGNISEVASYTVANIEKTVSGKPVATANITTPTTGDVLVSAMFSETAVTKEYTLDGGTWMPYTEPIRFSENGTVFFRSTDSAGVQSDITRYDVTNIDRTPPAQPMASADITTPTNGDVVVSAKFGDDSAIQEYSFDGETWNSYTEPLVFIENATVYFRAYDEAGNVSEITQFDVTNIDKIAPVKPTASASVTAMTSHDLTVTAKFSKDSVMREYSLDGEIWTDYTKAIVFTGNGTVYFRGTDEAGNVSEVTLFDVTNIHKGNLDDGTNDWLYDKKKEQKRNSDESFATFTLEEGISEIRLDPEGAVEDETRHNFVGIGDTVDFAKITLITASKLFFSLDATDTTKFTVWSLTEGKDKKGNTTWTQKSLQSTTLKKVKGSTDYAATTKALLLNAGDYYVSMQSTNKKNGYALYNVTLSETSTFYTSGDNSDDWTDMKGNGVASEEYATIGTITAETGLVLDNWVGFGDSVDYAQFSLDSASKLSFVTGATDATKLTIYRLTQDKKGKWSLKSLQSTTLKKAKKAEDYTAMTKGLLLESGEYYIAMESTNAKKGGSAYYTVELGTSTFYDAGDDGWNNYVYDKKAEEPMNQAEFVTTEITSGTTKVQLDLDPANEAWNNFVGFGDAVDYALITLSADATLSFSLTATDAAKFSVYRLTEGKKAGTFTMKSLQATTLKKAKGDELFSATTKALSLTEGEYYICMQSTNAAKGGSAFYNVELNHALCSGLSDAGIAAAMFDTTSEHIFEESEKGMLASL